jgi:SAM-dependent methyltransferase
MHPGSASQMKQIRFNPSPAVLLAVPDIEMQPYLQAHPFLNGTRREVNESLLASIEKLITIRRPHDACEVERLAPEELQLTTDNEKRVLALFEEIGHSADAIAEAMSLLAWKFRDLPADARSILDIGSGGGDEVVFLRAIAPQAKIVAIDWRDVHPKVKKLAGIQFLTGDFRQYLERTTEQFDVIFSNHVLEHLYDPDAVLTLMRRRLAPSGKMFGALPLDGAVASLWPRLESPAHQLTVVDLGAIDFGHPWKTTPSDLRETLLGAGFTSVRLVQRQHRVNRTSVGEESELLALESYGRRLDRLTFAPLRWTIRTLFGRLPPHAVVRVLYALESRAWFGPAQLKNSVSPEILAVAT